MQDFWPSPLPGQEKIRASIVAQPSFPHPLPDHRGDSCWNRPLTPPSQIGSDRNVCSAQALARGSFAKAIPQGSAQGGRDGMKLVHDGSAGFVRRDLVVFALIGVALGALTYRGTRLSPPAPQATLTATEAETKAAAGEITLIDIRRPDEWHSTGIAAPAHPLDMRQQDFLARLRDIVPPGTPVAVICARGVRSARVAAQMRQAGFDQVLDVPEGMIGSAAGPGWVARGLPLKPYDGET